MSDKAGDGSDETTSDAIKAPSKVDDDLRYVIAAITWNIPPVVNNIATIEALPQAAKNRQFKQLADNFASTGKNIFKHYVTPVLHERRRRLLASVTTKKTYTKTPQKLWSELKYEESFFWNEAARQLRTCMKQGLVSPKGCLVHAGKLEERAEYVWHAEVAVAEYLGLPAPEERCALMSVDRQPEEKGAQNGNGALSVYDPAKTNILENISNMTLSNHQDKDAIAHAVEKSLGVAIKTTANATGTSDNNLNTNAELLDTLPAPFEYEQNMLYSHFAKYDYNSVRSAVGKHQTAMLRQLADRFDKTGKILFYYYVVPRLCKQVYPPKTGETVTSKAADIWRFLEGGEKEKWRGASIEVKKLLGDGDICGLETLELGSLDVEVLRLHRLAQMAVDGDVKRPRAS